MRTRRSWHFASGSLLISLLISVGAAALLASNASGDTSDTRLITITRKDKLGFGKVSVSTAFGVATVNRSLGGDHLNVLRLAPTDPMDGAPVPVTDPETTGTIASNILDQGAGGAGTFSPISGGGPLTQASLPLGGVARICILFTGCGTSLPLILTINNGATGVGVGGLITTGGFGPIRLSLINSPWQLGTATRLQSTANGAVITRMFGGFIHGPASDTSSTAKQSGVISLVTPVQVLINVLLEKRGETGKRNASSRRSEVGDREPHTWPVRNGLHRLVPQAGRPPMQVVRALVQGLAADRLDERVHQHVRYCIRRDVVRRAEA